MKFYRKRRQQRSYLLFKGQVYENISRYCDSDLKIILLSQYCLVYCQLRKCFCFLRLILEATSQIISQNFESFQEEYLEKMFKMEFKISFQNILKRYWWSSVIVKPLPLRFTVILLVSETYNFMERYYDLWSFIPDLGLFSTISEFKR